MVKNTKSTRWVSCSPGLLVFLQEGSGSGFDDFDSDAEIMRVSRDFKAPLLAWETLILGLICADPVPHRGPPALRASRDNRALRDPGRRRRCSPDPLAYPGETGRMERPVDRAFP